MLLSTAIPKRSPARRAATVAAIVAIPGFLTLAGWANPVTARTFLTNRNAPGDLVDVQVQVDNRTAPLYQAPGRIDRLYFQAFRGRNYSIVVRNNTSERVAVLIAVDGLNVVNGERSALSRNEPMYVLDPHERAEIRGWRTSLDDIRKFVFVDEERSYAERSGQANADMGWIRVLSFRESGWRWPSIAERRMDGRQGTRDFGEKSNRAEDSRGAAPEAGNRAPSARGETSPQSVEPKMQVERDQSNPGTGWGERSRDHVNRTRFDPESSPTDHLVLRYEYASGLMALGIDVRRHRDRLWEREQGDFGFAQPPLW